jgi:hypothetical protein
MAFIDLNKHNFPSGSAVPKPNGMPRPAPVEYAPICRPRENCLIAQEIQEIRDALEAFKAAVEAGEMTGSRTVG